MTFLGSSGSVVVVEARVSILAPTESEVRALAAALHVVASRDSIYATGPEPTSTHYWSIDYTIRVPYQSDLNAKTIDGRVVVDGVRGAMDFATINGPIALRRAGGTVRGHSTNGPLQLDLTGSSWQGNGVFLESVNGPVDLHMPHEFDAHLELGTLDGAVRIEDDQTLRSSTRSNVIDSRVGSGGSTIHLQTMHGSLTVRLHSVSDRGSPSDHP